MNATETSNLRGHGLTGLLLGAGASHELGMPLLWELTAELKTWLTPQKLRVFNLGWRAQGGGHPDEVIENLAKILVIPEMHYEGILGYLENQYLRRGGHGHGQDYHALYQWLVDAIYIMLLERHYKIAGQLEGGLERYSGAVNLANENNPLWIFSINHDLLVECIAAHFKIPINCGFTATTEEFPKRDKTGTKTGDLTANVITEHELESVGMPFFQLGTYGINLLKVHGALDIFSYDDKKKFIKFTPSHPTVSGVLKMLRSINEDLRYIHPIYGEPRVRATGHIIFIDNTNDPEKPQLLRRTLMAGVFKFTHRYPQVLPKRFLEYFRANINHVRTLVAIGYSFNDVHINEVVRTWLEFSGERSLRIVDPNRREIPPSLIHLALQISLINSKTTEFFKSATSANLVASEASPR